MISDWAIQAAFRSKLITVSNIPSELAWENRGYSPEEDADGDPVPYIKEDLLHGDETVTANNETEQVGIMQYSLMYPSGSGTKDIKQAAHELKKAFKPTTVLNDLVRCEQVNAQKADAESPWYRIIVRISYTVYGTIS